MMLFFSCIQTICLTTLSEITALLAFLSGADLGPALQMYWLNVLVAYGCKINIQVFLVQRTDVCVWPVLRKIKTCQQMWSFHLLSQEIFMKSFFINSAIQASSWLQLRKHHTAWWILNYFPLLIKKIFIFLMNMKDLPCLFFFFYENIFIFHEYFIHVIWSMGEGRHREAFFGLQSFDTESILDLA